MARIEERLHHPLVEQWLQGRGLPYRHEFSYGGGMFRPDFVAFLPDGGLMVIECKTLLISRDSVNAALGQVYKYVVSILVQSGLKADYVVPALASEFSENAFYYVRRSGVTPIHIPYSLAHNNPLGKVARDDNLSFPALFNEPIDQTSKLINSGFYARQRYAKKSA